jgi:hypothetical protein
MNHKPTSFILATFLLVLGLATRAPATAVPLPDDPPLGLTWQISTLDSTGDVGSFISMAVQPTTGIPHIAYYSVEEGLKLAARTGNGNCGPQNSWDCQLLVPHTAQMAPTTGHYPSLAFQQNGAYGVVYQKPDGYANSIARVSVYRTASGEETQLVESQGASVIAGNGAHNALAYDAQNQYHIWSHQNRWGDDIKRLRYFGQASGNLSWHNGMVPTSIATDRNIFGNPAVAYAAYGDDFYTTLFHAEPRAGGNCYFGTWECSRVTTIESSIRPEIQNQRYIGMAFYQKKCLFDIELCNIPTTIAHYDLDLGLLYLAEKTAGASQRCYSDDPINSQVPDWRCTILGNVGMTPTGWLGNPNAYWPLGVDIVLYEKQLLVFFQMFYDGGKTRVMMAYKAAELGTGCGLPNHREWHCVVVDDGMRGSNFVSVGFGLQAEVLPDGRILLAYHDLSNRDLIIAETVLPQLPPPPSTTLTYLPLVVK